MEIIEGSQIETPCSSGETRAIQINCGFHDTCFPRSIASSCHAVHSEGSSDDG